MALLLSTRNRALRRLALVAVLLTGTAWAISKAPAQGEASTYSFSDISVSASQTDPGTAVVQYRVSWSSSSFPGVQTCTTRVFGLDGTVVGENTGKTVAMSSGNVASIGVPVAGAPATAQISCDPQRLDVGGPYGYEFSNVRVVPGASGQTAFSVVFDARWLGSGEPGAVRCTLNLYTDTGENVYSVPMTVLFMNGSAMDLEWSTGWDQVSEQLTQGDVARLSTAKFEGCAPIA